ncbi:dTDP-4-dehydrorhamnose 3,5-epimerase [uncultured Oscillibacter sp.]|uniref:dTDP-4-dehydrorhamnose 3,5-epimerase n=1 Tax=uncultured Oscillibacter sp. TaxID=876091 RepID=UPI0025F87A6B|nr:dTDP-4-dehydrorhamnose 3,5-epimerase [uncultured Oscillibacter sp.]
MAFQFEKTEIEDLRLITPFCANDRRGYYKKYYEISAFSKAGLPTHYSESSDIFSNKGAIRGLHYQQNDSQGKLLHVITGKIFDVALDLRPESRTFGKWKAFELSGDQLQMLYIPEGFAHGFMALEDHTYFSYQCTGKYDPSSCGGILWKDPKLGIPWPITDEAQLLLTEKDCSWPTFEEYVKKVRK